MPYFSPKFENGNKEKKYRFMVAVVFRFYSGFNRCNYRSLGMAYDDIAVSVHSLCERHGYYVIS